MKQYIPVYIGFTKGTGSPIRDSFVKTIGVNREIYLKQQDESLLIINVECTGDTDPVHEQIEKWWEQNNECIEFVRW